MGITVFYTSMVVHFTMRTYGVNQAFRFVEDNWSYQQSRQTRFFFLGILIFHHTCASCSELPSYISTIIWTMVTYKIVDQNPLRTHVSDISEILYIQIIRLTISGQINAKSVEKWKINKFEIFSLFVQYHKKSRGLEMELCCF